MIFGLAAQMTRMAIFSTTEFGSDAPVPQIGFEKASTNSKLYIEDRVQRSADNFKKTSLID